MLGHGNAPDVAEIVVHKLWKKVGKQAGQQSHKIRGLKQRNGGPNSRNWWNDGA